MTAPTTLALITGGGTGIGKAMAVALAANGATVIIAGRREEPLQETQAVIGADKCHIVAGADVGSTETWKKIVAKIDELGGALHLVSNNAGHEGTFLHLRKSSVALAWIFF